MGYVFVAWLAYHLQVFGFAEQAFDKAGEIGVALECAALHKVMHLGVLLDEPPAAHAALVLVLLELVWPLVGAFSRIAALVIWRIAGEGTPQGGTDEAPIAGLCPCSPAACLRGFRHQAWPL